MIRLSKEDKAEYTRLFVEAVKLQVQLYDKLGEIEDITGMVDGLDSAVSEEGSNWTDPELVVYSAKDIAFTLRNLERAE